MNDKLKAALDKAKNQWNKWSKVQKGIFGGVIALIVVAVIVLGTVSTQDGRVSLFNAPINDTQAFERIVTRLEEENVPFTTTADGRIYVDNSRIARRLKAVVVQEGLLPSNMDVWSFLNVNQFTVTDFEQKEKVRLAIAKDLEALLKSLDDVDNASVKIAMPETELFAEDNKPVTASVVITPSFSSDLVTNRAKIEGIERLVTRAIPRIDRENITITDNSGIGIELNSKNFQVVDRLHLTEAQLKIKQKAEKLLYEKVKRVLTNNGAGSAPIPPSRISISPVEIDMQFNEESYIYDEILPIILKADNPDTPYDDQQIIEKVLVESVVNTEEYNGTGFNPEGPAGVEGQVPPAYKDLQGLVARYGKDQSESRYETSKKQTTVNKTPWQINGISVSVLIDGITVKERDASGNYIESENGGIQRSYVPVDEETLRSLRSAVEGAIRYDQNRGDIVEVRNVQFDRTAEFEQEDNAYRTSKKVKQALFATLLTLVVLLSLIFLIRTIVHWRERRRKLREEERARQLAMERQAMLDRLDNPINIPMTGEDAEKNELFREAQVMAREHPEDVAQLIRAWLVEE